MQDELETIKKQAEEYLNNWKRERADFINYKKDEAKKDLELWIFKNGLLSTMDTIRDFLTGIYGNQSKSNLVEFIGIKKLQSSIEQTWAQIGIRKILVEGQRFDPKFHEAIDQEEEGERLEEVAPGYAIGDKIIRPAKVKIVK